MIASLTSLNCLSARDGIASTIVTTIITTYINHKDSFDVKSSYEILSKNITDFQTNINKDFSTLQNNINDIITKTDSINQKVTIIEESKHVEPDSLVPSKEATPKGDQ